MNVVRTMSKRKNLRPSAAAAVGTDELDLDFYSTWYRDLSELPAERLADHWANYGHKEGRHPNFLSLVKMEGFHEAEANEPFDYDFYVNYYGDVKRAGIQNKYEAKLHYLLYGKDEGRSPTIVRWIQDNLATPELPPGSWSFQDIEAVNAAEGVFVTLQMLMELLEGKVAYPIRVASDDSLNAEFFRALGKSYLQAGKSVPARNIIRTSLFFEKNSEALELIGNQYYELGDFQSAASYYEEAWRNSRANKLLPYQLANCKVRLVQTHEAIAVVQEALKHHRDFVPWDKLGEIIAEFWLKEQGAIEVLAIENARDKLVEKLRRASAAIYETYLLAYGAEKHPEFLKQCNVERVLIVGDFHIPQCERYRINQKIEQLETIGKQVTAISWLDLAEEQNQLAFHDIVIFYRVPAEPGVLKAMAQVNAVGKLSIYEIDDLLFEPSYPPSLESYGGSLDVNTYLEITRGMALFNAAARYCRYGLGSTRLLAEKLESVVFGRKSFVHRNGLDSLNYIKPVVEEEKQVVDIFYGSGTLAHNNDFLELAFPAIVRLLDEIAGVRLVVAGHLVLPPWFLKQYAGRVKRLPAVKNVTAYWSLLERADINIAVLHDDDVNGSKSELKWFEAAVLGVPSIVSATANYRDVIKNGVDGFVCENIEDWYQALKALVSDHKLRAKVAKNAQLRALDEYSVRTLAESLESNLRNTVELAKEPKQKVRKKIALVNVFFPPQSIGGATRVVADNFDVLQAKYGDEFELVVFTSEAQCTTPYTLSVYSYKGVNVYRATILWRENMDWHPTDPKMGDLFAEFLALEKPDLVHFHCIQRLTGSIVEATLKAKIPYIITIHDAWWISDHQFLVDADGRVYPEGHPDPYESYTLPNKISMGESIERRIYLKQLALGAKELLTVSKAFADIHHKNELVHVKVNSNGISEGINWVPKGTLYTDKVVCAHIGGMAMHKGYYLLKAAVEEVQPANIQMLIVDHSKDEGYRKQTFWGKVPVTFVGRVHQSNVVDLYGQVDVLFAPSTWPESYGLVTREAAACGCWIVASEIGGIGEDVIEGQSGHIVEPTVEAVEKALMQIDKTPARYKGLAQTGTSRGAGAQVSELAVIYSELEKVS